MNQFTISLFLYLLYSSNNFGMTTINGQIIDEHFNYLSCIDIINLTNNNLAVSDPMGQFEIQCEQGDQLQFVQECLYLSCPTVHLDSLNNNQLVSYSFETHTDCFKTKRLVFSRNVNIIMISGSSHLGHGSIKEMENWSCNYFGKLSKLYLKADRKKVWDI